MIFLGICESHGSSACLMRDGEIIGLVMEERFTKRKNQVAFPRLAIQELIRDHLNGDPGKIDKVVLAEQRIDPLGAGLMLDRYSEFGVMEHVQEMHELWRPYFYADGPHPYALRRAAFERGEFVNPDHNHDFGFVRDAKDNDEITEHFSAVERPAALERHFGWTDPIAHVEHHACHGYYALYGQALPVDRERALILTADAWGENSNWSASIPRPDGTLELLAHGTDHLVARLYKFTTLILGMKPNEHEYKVMGLAPYSRSAKHVRAVQDVYTEILDFRDGAFVRDRPLADSYFDLKDRLEGHRFDNVAAGLQAWSSDVTQKWIRHWTGETGCRVVCFSGGLAMNIRANGDILDMPEVEVLSIPAYGGDESLSPGACFGAWAEAEGPPRPLGHVYLGSEAQEPEDWRTAVRAAGHDPEAFARQEGVGTDDVARLLAADCIVARCVGRAEFGARALGNRSILANPSNVANVKTINNAIKNRDFWMPFTPSILSEHADRYLENPKNAVSPFMTIAFRSKPPNRDEIAGALHPADASARPQFVDRDTNAAYWELIEAFRRITGIPALLNTSLNLHGEPMNHTVADAIRTFALSELDVLVIPGDMLLYKARAKALLDDALEGQFQKVV